MFNLIDRDLLIINMPSSFSSSPPTTTTFSSPLLYPSSCSSANSVPPLTNLSSSSSSPYRRSSHTHDHLDSLIARHGRPHRFSLSSLEELTATCSTYSPPSPLDRPHSPVDDLADDLADSFETLTPYKTRSRPIPIPRSPLNAHEEDIPVTPLTGRFERDYFPHRDPSPVRSRPSYGSKSSKPSRRNSAYRSSRMRPESTTFVSQFASQPMGFPRSGSPQPALPRGQSAAKSAPTFHLGDLPRFHPAVYQSGSSQAMTGQPSSPRQSRQNVYRPGSASRDPISQYRDFVEGVTLQRPPSRPLSPSPSAPRLNPLRSPGPVTPLALEESGGYLSVGATNRSELSSRDVQHSAPTADVLDRLINRENEKVRQTSRKATKGW
ncbi:hypothetical protein BJX61DRAFT_239447 [Aspergillus egyptiacus]|nr:hypothetical protein BJX61DRAFT_239447 [Aspergillus egyptiacus]